MTLFAAHPAATMTALAVLAAACWGIALRLYWQRRQPTVTRIPAAPIRTVQFNAPHQDWEPVTRIPGGPTAPELPETGADENWSPLATIGTQDVSPALMTTEERVDALRSGTPLPVDLDGEAFERDLLRRFDALIDSTVAQLPDDERLAFELFRTRVRARGTRPDATGELDLAELRGEMAGAR